MHAAESTEFLTLEFTEANGVLIVADCFLHSVNYVFKKSTAKVQLYFDNSAL